MPESLNSLEIGLVSAEGIVFKPISIIIGTALLLQMDIYRSERVITSESDKSLFHSFAPSLFYARLGQVSQRLGDKDYVWAVIFSFPSRYSHTCINHTWIEFLLKLVLQYVNICTFKKKKILKSFSSFSFLIIKLC